MSEIDALWTLYGLDESRAKLLADVQRFPADRTALAKRLADERAHLEQLKTRLADQQKKRRDLEREAQALSDAEKRFQSQLPSVKKNEEYQALLHEIEGTKRKRSDLETEVLVTLEAEDETQRERPRLEQALRELEQEVESRHRVLEGEERAAREQVAALDVERGRHVEALATATRARYERVHALRGGRAVVPIAKGACGGCFRALPPQALQEARQRDRVLHCEGCGRMLVWPPDGAA